MTVSSFFSPLLGGDKYGDYAFRIVNYEVKRMSAMFVDATFDASFTRHSRSKRTPFLVRKSLQNRSENGFGRAFWMKLGAEAARK